MFDLEKHITEWRREMSEGGVKEPDILDELEGHLRDDFAQQTRSGTEPQEAFAAAVAHIGRGRALKQEFKKIASASRAMKHAGRAVLAFAGVPNHQLELSMNNNLNLEPRWATYLRSAVFLAPAFALWTLASIFVLPKVNEMWQKTGPGHELSSFDQIRRLDIAVVSVFQNDLVLIALALVLALGLLEWRSSLWPRFRRAFLGTGVFLFNLAILLSLFIQFLAATIVASAFAQHIK